MCHDDALYKFTFYLLAYIPRPPGRGSEAGRNFCQRLITANTQCLYLSERFFH